MQRDAGQVLRVELLKGHLLTSWILGQIVILHILDFPVELEHLDGNELDILSVLVLQHAQVDSTFRALSQILYDFVWKAFYFGRGIPTLFYHTISLLNLLLFATS